MFELQNMNDYSSKKKFLDCLEGTQGKIFDACSAMGLTEAFIEKLRFEDEIFSDAIQQIQDEIAIDASGGYQTTSLVVGIRPYDLMHTINARITFENENKRGIQLQTAKTMCRFIGYYRGIGWSVNQACSLTKITTATLWRWKKTYPEFNELFEAAETDSISEIYDAARKRALDPSASGDAMRAFILKHKGHTIGFSKPPGELQGPLVNVNVQNTPQQSDAIVRAHEKALESSMGVISIPQSTK